jgi:hypothetical protein
LRGFRPKTPEQQRDEQEGVNLYQRINPEFHTGRERNHAGAAHKNFAGFAAT